MKNKFYSFLILALLLPIFSESQEFDQSFLSSLPENIANDLQERSKNKNSLEATQYRRPSSFIQKPEPTSLRYGASIFSMMQTSLMPLNEPNFDSSYILDFGDELDLQLIGQKTSISKLRVKRDGSINIEDIGKIYVSGLSLNETANIIKSRINEAFIGVEAYVTLINVRDIQVIMAGNIYNPGTYTLNGNSNIFHALSVSGGPSENGSFRSIDLIRGNKKIESVDLYDTFIYGKPSFNTRLRSGDIVFVNPVRKIVSVNGAVRRSGTYELIDNESLSQAIFFANGLGDDADKNNIRLDRLLDGKIEGLPISNIIQFEKIIANGGDRVFIRKFPFRKITLSGAVLNPGLYLMNEGETLQDAVSKAGGYTETAYPFGAVYENVEVKLINENALEKLYQESLDNILELIKATGSEIDFNPLIVILNQLKNVNSTGRVIIDLMDENLIDPVLVKDNDTLLVPEKTNQVFVFGASNSTGAAKFQKGQSVNDYIGKMGGLRGNADINGIYILHPNGETIKYEMNRNIFAVQKNKIELYPGSVIYIPEKIESGYARRLAATAYASILGNIGVSLASVAVLK